MKITAKINLSFFAVSIICTAAAAIVMYMVARNILYRQIEAQLISQAHSRINHVETYLDTLTISIGQFAQSLALNDLLRATNAAAIRQSKEYEAAMMLIKKADQANPYIYEYSLMDKAGEVVASSNEKHIDLDKSADEIFLSGQDKIFIRDAFLDSEARPLMAVSAPLSKVRTGELMGVLAAFINLDELWKITAQTAGLGATGEMIIVNKNKIMITPSRFLPGAFLKHKADTKGVQEAFLSKTNKFIPHIFADYRGVPVLAAYGYIPRMQWVVIVKINASEAFAPLSKMFWSFWAILAVMTLAAWLLSRRIARLIAGPIKRLYDGAAIIGSGNLDYKVGTDANDEVGQLSRAFDAMTDNLKTTMTSIDNLNNEIAAHKRTEAQLRSRTVDLFESEENLAITLRSIGDALIATDTEGLVTRMNPVAEHLTGWLLVEATGKPLEDVFHIVNAQTRERVQNPLAKVLAGGLVVGLANHTALIARDGTIRQIADSAAPIRGADGRIRGVVLVFHDVTAEYQIREELKRNQEALASKTALLEAQLETSVDGILAVDNKGRTILFNERFGELWRIPRKILDSKDDKKMLEYTLNQLKDPAEFGRKVAYLYKYHDEKSRDEIDFADGRIFERYSAPLISADGNHFGRIWFFHDITERKRAEEALRESEEQLKNVFDSVKTGILVVDSSDLRVLEANQTASEMIGLPKNEIVGKICHNFVCPAQEGKCPIKHLGQTVDNSERALLTSDGRSIPILKTVVPIALRGRKCFLESFVDITERKWAEDALCQAKADLEKAYRQLQESFELESKLTVQVRAASAAKSQFVANVSHEIRTPLNGVIGICELLLETKMTREQLEYARTIKSSAEALLYIINSTLDFAKIEAGKMELENIDFNLSDLREDIISVLNVNAAKKKLELGGFIEPNVPVNLNGDPGRLRQVLINLIGNAIKFTNKGKVTVAVALVAEKEEKVVLRFSVRDTGIGIPADKTSLLFNAFFQVDASMARKFGGTGLGLAISKGLVEQMGGSIGVESIQGQGSTFWFTIPFLKQRSETKPSEALTNADAVSRGIPGLVNQEHEQYLSVRRLRILVAEDNMANQMVILGILKKMGHTAVAVADGNEAVKVLETIPYDLVLMDVQMPEMDGLEASAVIRDATSKVRDHSIPILALTAHTMPEDREKCRAAGMDGYITKPVSTKSIADAIASIAFPSGAAVYHDKNNKVQKNEPAVIFDSKAFSDRLSGDSALLREVVNIFLEETPKSICALESAITQKQQDEAVRLAHTIKGSAANSDGNQFRAVTARIETACKAGDWREAEALFPRLNKQFEFLERAMRNFVITLK
ncbi:MAG: PAS domain S-box protein [Kiritimatiellae bacterium]|nr:PAS domain S-box protein [Kiritimatiellia bacterium]